MCEVVKLPDGATAIVCGRGHSRASRCVKCGRLALLKCDGPGKAAGKTCDKAICNGCAKVVGHNLHLCPLCVANGVLTT